MTTLEQNLQACKTSSLQMLALTGEEKSKALLTFAQLVEDHREQLLLDNKKDLDEQKGEISSSLYQRLGLDNGKLDSIVQGVKDLAHAEEPVGRENFKMKLDEGFILTQISVPIGVIGVIFESRPDVIPQVLSLFLKSSNVGILKGGSEAIHSNRSFMELVKKLQELCPFLPENWATLIESRQQVNDLLAFDQYIDLMIPRGSNQLVQFIMQNTKIPVLGHADGICHIYVDASAAKEKIVPILVDAKVQYPSACNAMETLLLHDELSEDVIGKILSGLKANGVQLFGCEEAQKMDTDIQAVSRWDTEYGDLSLSVKFVSGIDAAISHINEFGSGHTDCILTEYENLAEEFFTRVDSASVMQNASTRFADGFRYGFGAEVGISTAKTHARGPVGIEGLLIYKYQLRGHGQIVSDYTGSDGKSFIHEKMD